MSDLSPSPVKTDPLLNNDKGHSAILLGNEAIVRGALEAGVAFASGYPGTPSSEVTDSFHRIAAAHGVVFEYSINEKIALEMAFAASLAGARSITAMKHLGLMVAGDPISTIPYMGVGAGMVIVSAGDPSCHTSPNEQDQRHLGPMLHIPVLDPSTPREAHAMTRLAFELSEKCNLPVLLRVTTRVAHSRSQVEFGPLKTAKVTGFIKDPSRLVPIPVNARRLRPAIEGKLATAATVCAEAGLFRRSGSGKQAILATGSPAASCADLVQEHRLENSVVLATVGCVFPYPEEELCALAREVDRILVVEELSPFLEDALHTICSRNNIQVEILGKRSGHLPIPFEYEPQTILGGIFKGLGLGLPLAQPRTSAPAELVPPRPPALCPACPHRSTYFAARVAFGENHLYFNDIGCYTLGYGSPLNTVDALLCMGAGFTLAAGVSRVTGDKTVGFLGDSTFFHSGMPALLNAIKENVNMVAVILDNQVTGMTGFQESPGVHVEDGEVHRDVSIEAVVRALGARHVEKIVPGNLPNAIAAFERARDTQGLAVVIAEEPCPLFIGPMGARGDAGTVYEINHDLCMTCGRDDCGKRCDVGITPGLQAHMARARALEIATKSGESKQGAKRYKVAPCASECPLGLCVQGYAGHIAGGEYAAAQKMIVDDCALPDAVCRVCHKPCEEVCVRSEIDGPVAINDLKRFVMDWAAGPDGTSYEFQPEPDNGMKAAIVGAGPAGLAAALELRKRGYGVTMYDAGSAPGGLLRTGIPPFRLPRKALQQDVDRVLSLGVEFVGNTVLGKDIQLGALLESTDAVLLAIGATRAVELGLDQGRDTPRVTDALAYLAQAFEESGAIPTGRQVVVVGGGNAAIDAARTALRDGARDVTVVYRRRREEMPALRLEIAEAELEGVRFQLQATPVRLEAGSVICVRTAPGQPDDSGRSRPVELQGTEFTVKADQVIAAIGQKPACDWLDAGAVDLEIREDGCVVVDRETGCTSYPGLFAAGDLVPGERTVTGAIAAGQRAAWGIDRTLRGQQAADVKPPPPLPGTWNEPYDGEDAPRFFREERCQRQVPDELPMADRTSLHAENIATLTEHQARTEANRCTVCGQCGDCRICLDMFGCPAFYMKDGKILIEAGLAAPRERS